MVENTVNLENVRYGTIAACDTNGLLRGQKISAASLKSALEDNSMGMAAVTLAVDPTDVILPMPGVTDDQADFHDDPLIVDQSSLRHIPFETATDNSLYLANFGKSTAQICPRTILQNVLSQAQKMGFNLKYGLEMEFTLFNETSDTLWEKDFSNLKTATRHGSHDLLIYQAAQSEFYREVADMCDALKINLAKMHEEIGGGFMEGCIGAGTGLEPADQLVLLKNFIRVLAMRRDQTVTFMPRWSETADSQSFHVHLSLIDNQGKPAFWDESAPNKMSKQFRHFIAGMQKYCADLMLVFAPTVNAYRRFDENTFAPALLSWGIDNRTTSFRVVGEVPGSLRFENRLPGSDSNPYLIVAASLAAGLAGMKEELEPTTQTTGNGYIPGQAYGEDFPHTMPEAIDRLRGSEFAAEYLGPRFVETFTATREAQFAQFEGKTLKDEMKRFFELG